MSRTLFANAGISMGGPTHELTRAHWDRIIDVNLNGVVNRLLGVLGHDHRGSGHIVATASGAGLLAPPSFATAYATTKHAVVGPSPGLRAEAIIVVPPSARSLWYLNRLSPALVGRISSHLARRVDSDLVMPRQ